VLIQDRGLFGHRREFSPELNWQLIKYLVLSSKPKPKCSLQLLMEAPSIP
jgi:hypothetical protein